MPNVNTVTIDKEYLREQLERSGKTANFVSRELGRSAHYVSNLMYPGSAGTLPVYTAERMAEIIGADFKRLTRREEKVKPEPMPDTSEYLKADDATLRQLVDQLYAMNAKLNVLYKMVAKIEEAVFNGTRV
nr:MAG TPA: helix-turn-helix domain protein [Caudoviricetes sp.]DAO90024.1 MAG TPA: helix-turn-helix domain protein [Caudoviricetes sp.]